MCCSLVAVGSVHLSPVFASAPSSPPAAAAASSSSSFSRLLLRSAAIVCTVCAAEKRETIVHTARSGTIPALLFISYRSSSSSSSRFKAGALLPVIPVASCHCASPARDPIVARADLSRFICCCWKLQTYLAALNSQTAGWREQPVFVHEPTMQIGAHHKRPASQLVVVIDGRGQRVWRIDTSCSPCTWQWPADWPTERASEQLNSIWLHGRQQWANGTARTTVAPSAIHKSPVLCPVSHQPSLICPPLEIDFILFPIGRPAANTWCSRA